MGEWVKQLAHKCTTLSETDNVSFDKMFCYAHNVVLQLKLGFNT